MKYAVRFHFYSTFENYLWHINTLILHNGIEWNVVMVGIYFTCLEAVFHSTLENYFWRRRPAGRQRWRRCPARCGRPSTRIVPTLAAAADRERWTSAAARLVRCVNSRTVLWLYWAVSHHRMCRYGSRVILRTIFVYVIFIVYMFWIHTCGI